MKKIAKAKMFEPETRGPIVLRFEADKTPNEVYEYVIDSIDKAVGVIVALGKPELLREGELRVQEFAARLHSAQSPYNHMPVRKEEI